MLPKTVLIFCSTQTGKDFRKIENQRLLLKFFGRNYKTKFLNRYPDDIPIEGRYDGVLFAGCNALNWVFHGDDYTLGMGKLWGCLKRGGKVIFVENNNYINHARHTPYSVIHPTLSIRLEEMMVLYEEDHPGLRGQILAEWSWLFKLHEKDNVFFYKKN
jgi:hypothetical protein